MLKFMLNESIISVAQTLSLCCEFSHWMVLKWAVMGADLGRELNTGSMWFYIGWQNVYHYKKIH